MRYLQICLANALICFAYAFLCVPNDILNGGVTCMAMIISRLSPMDASFCSSLIMCILLLFCLCFLGFSYFKGSLFSGLCYMTLFTIFYHIPLSIHLPIYISILLAAICVGAGYGLCLQAKATTVGFDTLALYIHKCNQKLSISTMMLCINVMIMLIGCFQFGVQAFIKGIIFIILQSFTMKIILKRKKVSYDGKSERNLSESE